MTDEQFEEGLRRMALEQARGDANPTYRQPRIIVPRTILEHVLTALVDHRGCSSCKALRAMVYQGPPSIEISDYDTKPEEVDALVVGSVVHIDTEGHDICDDCAATWVVFAALGAALAARGLCLTVITDPVALKAQRIQRKWVVAELKR